MPRPPSHGCTRRTSAPIRGGPTVAQRPEELVELLPEADRFLARGGRRRRAGRARRPGAGARPRRRLRRGPRRCAGRRPPAGRPPPRGHRPVRRRQPRRLPRAPAADDVQRRPLRGLRGTGDRALRPARTTPACRSCCCTAPSPTTRGSGSWPPSLRWSSGWRHLGGRHAGDPDARAAHPAGHGHRARDAPPADRAVSGVLGRDAHPRQRLGAAGAAPGRGRASTRWAWPRTCRTTWPRPPTPPPR